MYRAVEDISRLTYNVEGMLKCILSELRTKFERNQQAGEDEDILEEEHEAGSK